MPILSKQTIDELLNIIKKHKHGENIQNLDQKKEVLFCIKLLDKINKDDIRTFTIQYSPPHDKQENAIGLMVQSKKFPLYYTLYKPHDYDFKRVNYELNQQKINEVEMPNEIRLSSTHDSQVIRIPPSDAVGMLLEMKYSFTPTIQATASTYFGLVALTGLSLAVIITSGLNFEPLEKISQKHIEIGLFIIGASLILPQLSMNDSIRKRFIKWYVAVCILGVIVMVDIIPHLVKYCE